MYETEQRQIAAALQAMGPRVGAMVRKNWKRYAAVARLVERCLPATDAVRLLDFGCGYPVVTKLLQLRGYHATGFEPYAGEGEHMAARLLGLSTEHFRTALDADSRYDGVLLVDVVEHLSVPAPTLMRLGAHVADRGSLFVSTPNVLRFELYWSYVLRRTGHPTPLDKYLRATNDYVHHQRELTMDELRRLLEHFGYEIVEREFNDVRPGPADRPAPDGARGGIKSLAFSLLRPLMPASLVADNLMVAARKRAQ